MFISPKTAFAPAVHDVPSVMDEVSFTDLLSQGKGLAEIDVMIAPLIGPGFEAIDLIPFLGNAGFCGRLLVRSGTLPDRLMVLGELRAVARAYGFRVDLSCAA
jgi:hypothetical protein